MPSHHLPLLLAAYQHKFGRDLQAMVRHLIDDVAVGWDELGTDLLDGAPPALITALTGGEQWPSSTLDHLITPDGSPPVRMTVTDDTADAQDMQWGYILHQHGIEVISAPHEGSGQLVDWTTDPRTNFSDHPAHWVPIAPAPIIQPAHAAPPRSAPAAATAQAGAPRHTNRR
ncbi:hypothetical protein [Streptomyces sp. H39-C1]|uniref:hypothetical protein n=1 Tax=Streptomyces sp. H39-C1 TaxID=3004355 RepID=UPI0022AFCF01|nr:hypothetical protein [Streptomyces sp. H39-C1]MCZ4101812.1 hypothetical protein [Streptomyces sp. H39-C1]